MCVRKRREQIFEQEKKERRRRAMIGLPLASADADARMNIEKRSGVLCVCATILLLISR